MNSQSQTTTYKSFSFAQTIQLSPAKLPEVYGDHSVSEISSDFDQEDMNSRSLLDLQDIVRGDSKQANEEAKEHDENEEEENLFEDFLNGQLSPEEREKFISEMRDALKIQRAAASIALSENEDNGIFFIKPTPPQMDADAEENDQDEDDDVIILVNWIWNFPIKESFREPSRAQYNGRNKADVF